MKEINQDEQIYKNYRQKESLNIILLLIGRKFKEENYGKKKCSKKLYI